nr:hypothetical protein [Escherichia coli]
MNLHLTESSAHPGMLATAEAEREYWLNRQKAAVKAPSEIDVHTFHDALGLKWFTEFGHLNRGDMLTSEQHRCHNEKKKFQRRV